MALGGVCLFLLASALSHWDEVFLEFFRGGGGYHCFFFFRFGFVFVHKTQSTKHG